MDLKLLLTHEGAEYLRLWADAMPNAINNIHESTKQLMRIYHSVSERVGPHSESFHQMLLCVKSAQENCNGALGVLQAKLYATADKIDDFPAFVENDDSDQSPKVLKLVP